jgi:hypothetical protein
VHIKVGKKPSEHQEVHHIIALRDFDFSTKRQSYENGRDRDLFLLLVYTGLYYSDLKDLQKSDVKLDPEYGPYIWAGRFKNDNLSIIPLWKFPHAVTLFEKYKTENPKDQTYFTINLADVIEGTKGVDFKKIGLW